MLLGRAVVRGFVLPAVAPARRTVIVGAGPAGQAVAARLARRPSLGMELVGFVDDGTLADVSGATDAEELLADTYGLMIYQESVMRVSQKFAGFSLAEADNLRKATGKKKPELMALERNKFVDGCENTGYGAALGTHLFDIIEGFANYAFNKSHSFGYGLVTFQTAYLKAHYPVEYLAALLTSGP